MGAEGPPAREASVPAPQGPRRRAAKRLELLVDYIVRTWNNLPIELRAIPKIMSFKKAFVKYKLAFYA